MLKGTTSVFVDITTGDEFGIYRKNDSGDKFLLLAFSDKNEALEKGFKLSELLEIPFVSKLHKDDGTKQQDRIVTNERPKRIQVRGIGLLCKQLVDQDKPTEEIYEILIPKYLEAGRTETEARSNIRWYLKEACKGK